MMEIVHKYCLACVVLIWLLGCNYSNPEKAAIHLPGGFELWAGMQGYDEILYRDELPAIVPGKVFRIGWSDRVVVALQHPLAAPSPSSSAGTLMLPDESKVFYWVLDASEGVASGPFSFAECHEYMDYQRFAMPPLRDVKDAIRRFGY